MARRGLEEWKDAVFRHKWGPNANVGMLLMYLAVRHMKADLTVSVPRARIAEDLNVDASRITAWMKAARDAGFLASITRGKPGTTAVYKAMFPSPVYGADGSTIKAAAKGAAHGVVGRTIKKPTYGAHGFATMKQHLPCEEASAAEKPASGFTGETSFAPLALENFHSGTGRGEGKEFEEKCGSTTVGRETRRHLLTAVQKAAGGSGDALDDLLNLLDEHYGAEVAGYAANYWRSVPKKAADSRYEAGKWLNKLVNTARLKC